jgi:hypothetical protein
MAKFRDSASCGISYQPLPTHPQNRYLTRLIILLLLQSYSLHSYAPGASFSRTWHKDFPLLVALFLR